MNYYKESIEYLSIVIFDFNKLETKCWLTRFEDETIKLNEERKEGEKELDSFIPMNALDLSSVVEYVYKYWTGGFDVKTEHAIKELSEKTIKENDSIHEHYKRIIIQFDKKGMIANVVSNIENKVKIFYILDALHKKFQQDLIAGSLQKTLMNLSRIMPTAPGNIPVMKSGKHPLMP